MQTIEGNPVRAGAIGFGMGAGFAGAFRGLDTLGLALVDFDTSAVTRPQWVMVVALVALGLAALILWVLPSAGRVCAGVALASAVGVVVSVVLATETAREVGVWGVVGRTALTHLLIVLAILAVAWAWSRPEAGPVRFGDVALGALVALALTTLPQLVESVVVAVDVPWDADRGLGIVAGFAVVLAGVVAALALADRAPVAAAAVVALGAGLVLAVSGVRTVMIVQDYFANGGLRAQWSLSASLLAHFGHVVLTLLLGLTLLRKGRAETGAPPATRWGGADPSA